MVFLEKRNILFCVFPFSLRVTPAPPYVAITGNFEYFTSALREANTTTLYTVISRNTQVDGWHFIIILLFCLYL